MKHMDQERQQREEKIEKCEDDRECCRQELMMALIASITDKEKKIEEYELTVLNMSQDIMEYQEKAFKLIQEQQDAFNKKHSFIKDNSKDNNKDNDETQDKE
eukprot:10868811-Ditylum_brightwellii.AAC.1